MDVAEARERFSAARVARLATLGESASGSMAPHLVPIVFAVAGDTIYHAVDGKPKTTTDLRRFRNVAAHPAVCVLADHYDDADWSGLWWVRADGVGRLVTEPRQREAAIDALAERYAQYRETRPLGPVLAIDVGRWSGWRG